MSATQALVRETPEQDSNPDLSNASAVFYELSYQANLDMTTMWVYHKHVNDGIFKPYNYGACLCH